MVICSKAYQRDFDLHPIFYHKSTCNQLRHPLLVDKYYTLPARKVLKFLLQQSFLLEQLDLVVNILSSWFVSPQQVQRSRQFSMKKFSLNHELLVNYHTDQFSYAFHFHEIQVEFSALSTSHLLSHILEKMHSEL